MQGDLEMKNNIILTRDLIHACKSSRGGFTNAQIEYLGFNPKEKWIKDAIGNKLTDEQFNLFKTYGNTRANVLRKLKNEGSFIPLN